MAFGIYVHIPYCLQRCTYCDFATYEKSQILPPEKYTEILIQEIRQRARFTPTKNLSTIYFGGGTPSLIPAENIVAVLQELSSLGFQTGPDTEITIEINPATIDPKKMEIYLKHGINRFSVGAQTFNDPLLKSVHREHNSQQTRDTLDLLQSYKVNYSFDILFALPGQTLDILKNDLEFVLKYRPHHVSPYCLTVPEGHILSKTKLSDELQLNMFNEISSTLLSAGYEQYEISNFSRDGFYSKHNSLYWDDEEYWGIGLSAHSYYKNNPWGIRFWNPNAIGQYEAHILKNSTLIDEDDITRHLEKASFENLQLHQSVTDYCHTSLRRKKGLIKSDFIQKFGNKIFMKIEPILAQQVEVGLLHFSSPLNHWYLSSEGILISNQVFSAMTFLKGELPS